MGWALNGTTSSTVTAGTNSGYIPVNLKFTTGGWNLAGETRYIYDGMTVVQERDQNNVPLVTYTRGNDLSGSLQGAGGIGGLLARTDQTASAPSHSYYHSDGNGNITAMVSFQQNLVARYLYDPFGNTLAKAGSLADANSYRFSSKEWHAGSTLYYFGYRFYSPGIQRWLNRDPLGEAGGINLYRFDYNDPNSWIDPDGESPEGIIGGGGAGAIIGGIIGGGIGTIGIIIPPLAPITITIGAGEGAVVGGLIGGWIGSTLPSQPIVCESRGHGERGIGKDPNPWKGYRPKDPNDPSKGGWKPDPQTGKDKPVRRPEGPPPKNHPNW